MTRAAALAARVTLACVTLAACGGLSAGPGLAPVVSGYLDAGQIRSLADATPPPSGVTSQVFDTPKPDRWWLATAHAELRPPEAAQHFDCALGARLTATPRPALKRVMDRLLADAGAVTRLLAERSPRARPILAIEGLEPCQRVTEAARRDPAWPAGGAVAGSVYGELFAELAPDRADQARRIGEEIGLSRAVCRMNWPSDVTDGAAVGRRLFAAQSRSPGFRADLEAARAEVAAARAGGLSNPGCAAERRALGLTPDGD